ncbi:566_t:CDS:2 [Entrophospora sp. SA101]|nr:566_t:CDS:2 [Entrophospora sp. SA101]
MWFLNGNVLTKLFVHYPFFDDGNKEPNPEVDDFDEEEEVEMMVISDKEALNSDSIFKKSTG